MVIFLKYIKTHYSNMTPKVHEHRMDKKLGGFLTSQHILNTDSPEGIVFKIVNW